MLLSDIVTGEARAEACAFPPSSQPEAMKELGNG